jgi:hypothetical protein
MKLSLGEHLLTFAELQHPENTAFLKSFVTYLCLTESCPELSRTRVDKGAN